MSQSFSNDHNTSDMDASSSNSCQGPTRSRGRPRKDSEAKYATAYDEVRRRSIKVHTVRMAQAYHGHQWVNRKMRRAFLKAYRLAERNGGFLPVVESRRVFGRWIQTLEGSHGFMKHKAVNCEGEVEVPDDYIIPPINFHRAIRGHIFAEVWDDVDIKNCHYVLTRDICQKLGISCPAIRKYIEERGDELNGILGSVITHCGGKITRDDAKALFLRLLYGGSWSGFVNDLTKPRKDADGNPLPPRIKLTNKETAEPSFCRELYDEMTRVYCEWTEKDSVEYAKVLEQRVLQWEVLEFSDDHRKQTPQRKTQSKCFATYVQTFERSVIDACMKHCEERGLRTGVYMYDGFLIQKGGCTPELRDTFKRISAQQGFDLDFEEKTMSLVDEWDGMSGIIYADEDDEVVQELARAESEATEMEEEEEQFGEEFCRWARANPGVDQVLDVFKSVVGGLDGFAYDGSKVFRIDDVSGRYIIYEKDDQWKKEIGARVKSVLLPLWERFARRRWSDPPSEYITVTDKGKENVKYLTWRKDLDTTTKLLNDSIGFMGRVAEAFRNCVFDQKMSSEEGLDTRTWLIGFDNGIVDLTQKDGEGRFIFRKARLDEYVSKTAGYAYEFVDKDDPLYVRCFNILANLWVKRKPGDTAKGQYGDLMDEDEDPRGYETFRKAMMLICSNMKGGNAIQSLLMLIGSGANGKSVLINFMRAALGQYCVVIPGWFWESTRKSAEGGAPFLLNLRGARYAFTQEISSDPKVVLDTQRMKNITGGDEQAARYLFDNVIHRFFVDAMPIWNVNNLPENWSERGYAVTRRPKGVPFPFKYSSEELDLDYAKMTDEELESREFRRNIGLPMMQIMLDFFDMYLSQVPFVKVPMSRDMVEVTNDVKGAIDEFATFVREKLQFVNDDRFFVPVKYLLTMYQEESGNAKITADTFGKAIAAEMRELLGVGKAKTCLVRCGYDGGCGAERVWAKVILKDAEDAVGLVGRLAGGRNKNVEALVNAYGERDEEVETEIDGRMAKVLKYMGIGGAATTEPPKKSTYGMVRPSS